MIVRAASRSQPVRFLRRCCGFSTLAPSGTCFRRPTRTTRRYIAAFSSSAKTK
jgi:hypothetical protein